MSNTPHERLQTYITNVKSLFDTTQNDKLGYLDSSENKLSVVDGPFKDLENTEDNKNKLKKILLTRNRMLEVNLDRNATKNKIIYSMFSFIILLVFIITLIHYNIKN
tara:strand:+ start:495 stop:815 length:321 start_codon:yes stop_codon:yes gene_type:complete